jgi:hypothetical protein
MLSYACVYVCYAFVNREHVMILMHSQQLGVLLNETNPASLDW